MASFCVIGAQSQAARQGFTLCVVSAFLIGGIGSKMHKDQSQNLCNFLCKIRLHEIPIHDIIRGKLRETNTHTERSLQDGTEENDYGY